MTVADTSGAWWPWVAIGLAAYFVYAVWMVSMGGPVRHVRPMELSPDNPFLPKRPAADAAGPPERDADAERKERS